MSSEMNITAAIGMSSGDPGHRQVLQQTWSSVSHLVNVSGKVASFRVLENFSDALISEGPIKPRQQSNRCPPLMSSKTVTLHAI
jgi:hypothetical protein